MARKNSRNVDRNTLLLVFIALLAVISIVLLFQMNQNITGAAQFRALDPGRYVVDIGPEGKLIAPPAEVPPDFAVAPEGSGGQMAPEGSGGQMAPEGSGGQMAPEGSGGQMAPEGSGGQMADAEIQGSGGQM